jgi:SAM-dependent methyltransferase
MSKILIVIKNNFHKELTQYILKKYSAFTIAHYSEKGLGYFDYSYLSNTAYVEIYRNQYGRIRYYIEKNSSLVPYKNGDSFLDVGCGRGQSIKVLSEFFPDSIIEGFDCNDFALNAIRYGTENNDNIHVKVGDITNGEFLKTFLDESFDHVILSHVIGFIADTNILKTKQLRQQLVDNLVRICSNSVMILDSIENISVMTAEIEQNTRCIVHDRLMNYFSHNIDNGEGELFAMFSKEDSALLYLKKN